MTTLTVVVFPVISNMGVSTNKQEDKNLTSTLLTVHAVRIKGGVLINPPLAYANFNITTTPPFLGIVPLHLLSLLN